MKRLMGRRDSKDLGVRKQTILTRILAAPYLVMLILLLLK